MDSFFLPLVTFAPVGALDTCTRLRHHFISRCTIIMSNPEHIYSYHTTPHRNSPSRFKAAEKLNLQNFRGTPLSDVLEASSDFMTPKIKFISSLSSRLWSFSDRWVIQSGRYSTIPRERTR